MLKAWKYQIIETLSNRPSRFILRLVIDNKRAAIIDLSSLKVEEAIQEQRDRWGKRLISIEARRRYTDGVANPL